MRPLRKQKGKPLPDEFKAMVQSMDVPRHSTILIKSDVPLTDAERCTLADAMRKGIADESINIVVLDKSLKVCILKPDEDMPVLDTTDGVMTEAQLRVMNGT